MLEGQMTVDEVLRHLAETRGARRHPAPPTSAAAPADRHHQLELRIRDLRGRRGDHAAQLVLQPLPAC